MRTTATERALRALPPRWTAVLYLVDVTGLPPAEAAARLGMSTTATTALLARARRALRAAGA